MVISNYSICLSLTYFTKHNIHRVHPRCCKQRNCILAEWCSIEHIYHIFHIYSSVNGHLGHFHIVATVKNAAIYNGVCCLFQIVFFNHFSSKKKPGLRNQQDLTSHLYLTYQQNWDPRDATKYPPHLNSWSGRNKVRPTPAVLSSTLLLPHALGSGGTCWLPGRVIHLLTRFQDTPITPAPTGLAPLSTLQSVLVRTSLVV